MDQQRIAHIFDSGYTASIALAGGGSGLLSAILATPGASNFLHEAQVPYSPAALKRHLGDAPERAVAPETARAMAAVAFDRLISDDAGGSLIGIGCTAALQTNRDRRGDDRAFICLKTATSERLFALYLSEGTRVEQESMLSDWLSVLIAQAVGVERGLMVSGSFNPVHSGHRGMRIAAQHSTGLRGVFELSAVNVDKPNIPEEEILRRVSAIRDIPIAITAAPRFTGKASNFPSTTFVVGYDTAERLIDYAIGDEWSHFDAADSSFLVMGRLLQAAQQKSGAQAADCQQFYGAEHLAMPPESVHLFEGISEELFREDISSSELRNPS